MSTAPLSPDDIRAAAEVHRELGPEYSDAVVASFLAKIDREIDARVEARVAGTRQGRAAVPDSRVALIKGIAIGGIVTGTSLLAAMSGSGDEGKRRLLFVLVIWLAVAVGYAISVARARRHSTNSRNSAGR